MVKPVQGRVTAGFSQARPLTAVVKTHPHGAIDIGARIGTKIVAPEAGELVYFKAVRANNTQRWYEVEWKGQPFPFQNYFYDVYGSVIFLIGKSGLWHVITHSYWNQLYNLGSVGSENIRYQEQGADARFPIFCYHNLEKPVKVYRGAEIGAVGNAGFSTGAHAHIEIHEGKFQKHKDRPRPEDIYGYEEMV